MRNHVAITHPANRREMRNGFELTAMLELTAMQIPMDLLGLHDVKFTFPSGKAISCNRFVLAARVPVFRAMLYGHMKEATDDVYISDSSPEAFKQFINFMYCDSLDETADVSLVHQVLGIARKYCFATLQLHCESLLAQKLSPLNAGTCCLEAYRAGNYELVSVCLQAIARSLTSTPSSEIAKLPLQCMQLLVQADETAAPEVDIFKACVSWAQSRSNDLKSEMQCLLPHIRFENMSPKQFAEHVVPSGLLSPEFVLDLMCAGVGGKSVSRHRRCTNSIIIAGGCVGRGSALNTAYELDSQFSAWRRLPDMNTARIYGGGCVCRGIMYCVGGLTYSGGTRSTLKSAEALLNRTDDWVALPHLPEMARSRFALCLLENQVYVLADYGDNWSYLASVFMFDFETRQWVSKPSLSTANAYCIAVVLDGKIFLTGGYDGHQTHSRVECYDPSCDSWTSITPMLSARSLHASCAFGGKLFVFGGLEAPTSAECYDPATGQWTELAPMPEPRIAHGCAVWEDSILVCGGSFDDTPSNTCDRYYPSTNTWERTSLKLPRAMDGFVMCAG